MKEKRSAGHTVKFSGRTWYEIRIRETEGPSSGIFQKGDTHERNPCAHKLEDRTHEETSRQEDCARKVAWSLAKKIFKLKAEDKATFYSLVEIKAPVLVSKNTAERMFVVDSAASMHMLSKKDSSSDELDTLTRSTNITTVMTAKGEVQTNEEAQVYVQDLDLFVSVQLPEDTPAVLSLGEHCEDHGYSNEWANGQKPCLIGNGVPIQLQYKELRSDRGPGSFYGFLFIELTATPTSLPQESSGSIPIPAQVDNERADERERRNQFQTHPTIQQPIKMRVTSRNGYPAFLRNT